MFIYFYFYFFFLFENKACRRPPHFWGGGGVQKNTKLAVYNKCLVSLQQLNRFFKIVMSRLDSIRRTLKNAGDFYCVINILQCKITVLINCDNPTLSVIVSDADIQTIDKTKFAEISPMAVTAAHSLINAKTQTFPYKRATAIE